MLSLVLNKGVLKIYLNGNIMQSIVSNNFNKIHCGKDMTIFIGVIHQTQLWKGLII
jgi:hypothetical protein